MSYLFRFAWPEVLYVLVPVLVALVLYRFRWHKKAVYSYPLTNTLKAAKKTTRHPYKKIFSLMRFITLATLALLIAKPQSVDVRSKVDVEGIDILLTLDVSGSMELRDDKKDPRSRVEIAKAEAIRFIEKRDNDAIGLVIFGADAVSRCPLTMDKNILNDIVRDLKVGVVNADGTSLSTAIVTAANRLKDSKAKSKIIILLTDGEPSEHDISPELAIEAAKKLGIKVYTVGIGNDKEKLVRHPIYGVISLPRVNVPLLEKIAQQTGGKFFMAHNSSDMRSIYDTIDALETTTHETPIFTMYHDIFMPFVWGLFALLLLESLLTSLVWFGI